ncbi:hypothetical protein DA2_1200 [Desulfovibrio sp. A2]|nr:hypothetical protein DA2_1200 [Desulfovibrio sp. A2]
MTGKYVAEDSGTVENGMAAACRHAAATERPPARAGGLGGAW